MEPLSAAPFEKFLDGAIAFGTLGLAGYEVLTNWDSILGTAWEDKGAVLAVGATAVAVRDSKST